MKFLFLSGHAHFALDPSSLRASGGAELQVALLSKALVQQGHQVSLLSADTGQGDRTVWEKINIRTGGRFDTGRLFDTLFSIPRMMNILLEERPDVVVVYGWTSLLYLLAKLRCITAYKLVFICALDSEIDGGFFRENPLRGYFLKQGMRFSDTRFGITEHQAHLFQKEGMSCSVTRLLLQDNKKIIPIPLTEKSIDLLWVARCQPVKQPLLFLDIAERFPQARCQMICSPQHQQLWQSVKKRAECLPNVEFFEAIPYRDIQLYFNRAKIFVNTSLDEGVPNTFIHAGIGSTAIASLRVDPDSMLQQFHAGICADDDSEKLFLGISALLRNDISLTFAQKEAARFVRTWHDNEKNITAFLEGISSL